MLRNYLQVALRNLKRHVGYTLLNVLGLATGLACVLLIGLWMQDELSYDAFHKDADRTYRVVREWNLPQLQSTLNATPSALAPTLARNQPQVDAAVRTIAQNGVMQHEMHTHVQRDVLFADDGFFDLFSFSVVRGAAVLNRPGTVVLTPETTQRYFGTSDPVGQTLRFEGTEFTVTGVVESPPSNSSIAYSAVASMATREPEENWFQNNYSTYVKLRAGVSPDAFEANALTPLIKEHLFPFYRERFYDGGDVPTDAAQLHMQPLTGIHLGQGAPADLSSEGSMTYVWLFGALAAFVLLLACINFTNLSTVRSLRRANEVGIRKAMGAGRRQLAGQFLGESVVMVALATLLAVGAAAAVLPAFNTLAGKSITVVSVVRLGNGLALLGLVGVVGLLAGGYPALVLSRFTPTQTLRGRTASGQGSPLLRKALVVLQFAVSVALLAGTVVVHNQVSYMQSKGLGFTAENVVVLDRLRTLQTPLRTRADVRALQDRIATLKQEMSGVPGVESVASGYSLPGTFFVNSMWTVDDPQADEHNMDYTFVGNDYVETLDLPLVAGRDFSPAHPADTAAVVLNETAVREFGFASPRDALGHNVMRGDQPITIIGVVEDFHYASLHKEIGPVLLFHEALRLPQYLAVRTAPGNTASVLENVRRTWQSVADLPLSYSFLADDLDAQYRAEVRVERLFSTFSGLALLIACLGLLGLAAYAAQQRTKEIGIRKAMGASVAGIIGLLSKDFLKLVGIAALVAAPVAYYGMSQWLQRFAYRIDPGPWVFVMASSAALLIAALTVSYQAWRAAQTDPARALRSE
jgi:putative ABC transport system permease protein